MPLYYYKCYTCKRDFEVRHGMFFEHQRCVFCRSDDVQRVPSEIVLSNIKDDDQAPTTGRIVDKYIEDTKREVKKEKKKLKEQEL